MRKLRPLFSITPDLHRTFKPATGTGTTHKAMVQNKSRPAKQHMHRVAEGRCKARDALPWTSCQQIHNVPSVKLVKLYVAKPCVTCHQSNEAVNLLSRLDAVQERTGAAQSSLLLPVTTATATATADAANPPDSNVHRNQDSPRWHQQLQHTSAQQQP
jgi:hypothetical protein